MPDPWDGKNAVTVTGLHSGGFAAGTDLRALAERWGTPLYVLDRDRLRANVASFTSVVAPVEMLFSLKTNYLPAVTSVLLAAGAGVDVVSGYELRAALRAGFPPDRIVFNGPVKTAGELREAAGAGVFVNIDGPAEVRTLAAVARERGTVLPVGLRVFPPHDVYSDQRPLAPRRIPSKFGWPIAGGDADRMAQLIMSTPELRLTGFHCHLGSQITRTDALQEATDALLAWVAGWCRRTPLDQLNIGGGFGVPGIHRIRGAVAGLSEVTSAADTGPRGHFDLELFSARLRAGLRRHGLDGLRVRCEPGRAVVSDVMALLTRVVDVKRTSQGSWVLLDGGLNLLPTAGVAEVHRFEALRRESVDEPYLLAGPLCYEGDVFALEARLPRDIREGDPVLIHDAGAYSVTRATSFNRPRAAVAEVSAGVSRLCWRAEEDEDIFGFEVLADLPYAGVTG